MKTSHREPKLTLGRHIPLTVVFTLLVQAGGILIWATQLDARVNVIEQQSMNTTSMNEKFARLEERLDGMRQNIDDMKRQLNRLTDRLLN